MTRGERREFLGMTRHETTKRTATRQEENIKLIRYLLRAARVASQLSMLRVGPGGNQCVAPTTQSSKHDEEPCMMYPRV